MKPVLWVLVVLPLVQTIPEQSHPSLVDANSDPHQALQDDLYKESSGRGVAAHIAGGEEARRHAFPHIVFLDMKLSNWASSFCGGSLISTECVLTAAHCLINKRAVNVILGSHNRGAKEENSRQSIKAANIFIHEGFKHNNTDIALIKLSAPAKLNQYVQTIRLPAWSQRGKDLGGLPAEIIGWGKYNEAILESSQFLRAAHTRLMRHGDCVNTYNRFKKGAITPWHICSDGSYRKGPCRGDSGGPIFITEADNIRTVVGIVAFGSPNGCDYGDPAVYTRVDYWLEWINKVTGIPIRK